MEEKEKIYCIFNNERENIDVQIEKVFKEYLKDSIKCNQDQHIEELDTMKTNKELEVQIKQLYNHLCR